MQISSIGSNYDYGSILSGLMPGAVGTQTQGPPLATMQFSTVDTDGNGSVSLSEFETALEQGSSTAGASGSSSVSDAQASNLFKKIDTNGDGQISQTEWNTFQQKMQSHHHHHHHASGNADSTQNSTQSLQSLVSQLYKDADTNGDGQLSQSELTSFLQNAMGSNSVNQVA